jgi:hypothetical protein
MPGRTPLQSRPWIGSSAVRFAEISNSDPEDPARPYKTASCVSGLNTCIFFMSMTTSVL